MAAKAFPYLFNAIGYTFGGSAGTFKLPDGRGRVTGNVNTATIGGPLDMNGNPISQRPFGTITGEETHILSVAEMPTHNHGGVTGTSTTGITHNATGPTPGGGGNGNGYGLIYQDGNNTMNASVNVGNEPNLYQSIGALVLTDPGHSHTIANQGSSAAHNNMQPTVYMGNLFVYSGMKDMNTLVPFIFN